VERFLKAWFDYSERRMVQAIRVLPSGEFVATTMHDPFPGAPDGIPLSIKIRCDSKEGLLELDLRDNPDCIPAGINSSETTARAAALTGVLNTIDPSVPHNAGSFRRVTVLLRENCVAGIPRFPASCSLATTDITDRIINMTQAAFAEHCPGWGLAEGPTGIPPGHSVIYGNDPRRGSAPYITQLLIDTAGGPASPVGDGWLSYVLPCTGGVLYRDSVEVIEQKYPICVHESMVWPDAEGAGQYRGGPGAMCSYGPIAGQMELSYSIDGMVTPAQGVCGGLSARSAAVFLIRHSGELEKLSEPVKRVVLMPGERIGVRTAGGGGYGPPSQRDSSAVLKDVRDGYVTIGRAQDVYGVSIAGDPDKPETLTVMQADGQIRRLLAPR
ncbi:MAG TPA: hydantoinase B/oxoprolinase family protein, partial [Candidatus Binatia bacterium]|nr:hydantoinase B/oxoprolinase family protein [Candidatus Binatia bacterium]